MAVIDSLIKGIQSVIAVGLIDTSPSNDSIVIYEMFIASTLISVLCDVYRLQKNTNGMYKIELN